MLLQICKTVGLLGGKELMMLGLKVLPQVLPRMSRSLGEQVHMGLETHWEDVTVESGICMGPCQHPGATVCQGPPLRHRSSMFAEDLHSIKTSLMWSVTEKINPAALFSSILHRLQSNLLGGTCTSLLSRGLVVPISLRCPEVLAFLGSGPQSQHLVALLSAVNCVGALLLCWIEGSLHNTFESCLHPWRVSNICWPFLSSRDEIEIVVSCFISSFKNYSDKTNGLLSPSIALISLWHSTAPFP